jgi:hypothetical protein
VEEEVEEVVTGELPVGVEVVSVMPTKKANVQEALPVDFLIKYLKLYHLTLDLLTALLYNKISRFSINSRIGRTY